MTSRVLVALRIAASPERVFEAFTNEIDQWWRPNALFQFTEYRTGRMAFEPGPDGRLIETYDDGDVFEIGRIREWEPPTRLVFSWRQSRLWTGDPVVQRLEQRLPWRAHPRPTPKNDGGRVGTVQLGRER